MSIARKSSLVFMNTVAGAAMGFIALKAMATYLPATAVGEVEYALGILGTLLFITDLGFPGAHVKRVSEGENEADCFVTFTGFKLVATLVFLALASILPLYFIFVKGQPVSRPWDDLSLTAYLLMAGYFSLSSLRGIVQSSFDARRESARSQLNLLIENVVRIAITVLVALLFAGAAWKYGPLAGFLTAENPVVRLIVHYPAGALAFAWFAGGLASAAAAFTYWRSVGASGGRFRWDILKGYATFALPMFFAYMAGSISNYVDRVFLGFFLGAEETATFGLVRRITAVVDGIPFAVGLLLFPTLSRLHAQGGRAQIAALTNDSVRWVSLLVFPIIVFIAVLPHELISIFLSDKYQAGALAFSLLAIYTLFMALSRPYVALLSGVDRNDLNGRIAIGMSLLNIVLNFLFIPYDIQSLGIRLLGLGATGAALATLISGLAGYLMYRSAAMRLTGVQETRSPLRHLAAGLLMAAVLLALDASVDVERWYHVLGYGLAGGLAYLGGLVLLREITRADVAFILDTIHPGEMASYVRGELTLRKRD